VIRNTVSIQNPTMESTDPSDTDIITRIRAGEKELYRLLMERYASLVLHVVSRFETDHNLKTEMAHDIFLKAYERLDSFKGNSAFSSWLYRLGQNHCLDHNRRKKHRNSLFTEMPDDHSAEIVDEASVPDDALDEAAASNRLRKALDKISDNCTVPLLMKYRDGMSYEAISKDLQVPVGALKVRVHRARKELKQHLEQKI